MAYPLKSSNPAEEDRIRKEMSDYWAIRAVAKLIAFIVILGIVLLIEPFYSKEGLGVIDIAWRIAVGLLFVFGIPGIMVYKATELRKTDEYLSFGAAMESAYDSMVAGALRVMRREPSEADAINHKEWTNTFKH